MLSMAAFATYLLLPAAPPWWAAAAGHLSSPAGQPALSHLEGGAIDGLVGVLGLQGSALASVAFGDLSPDPVAAFPSLHAAYPVLGDPCLRAVSGPAKWLMLTYAGGACFAIVYLGDHYLIDIVGALVYAYAAWRLVRRSSRSLWAPTLPGVRPALTAIPAPLADVRFAFDRQARAAIGPKVRATAHRLHHGPSPEEGT